MDTPGVWPSAPRSGGAPTPAGGRGSATGTRPSTCLGPRSSGCRRPRAAPGSTSPWGSSKGNSTYSRGTLFCTLLYLGPDGALLGKHRKLKPTAAERLIWGEGDGSTLTAVETPHGTVGGLICWENYMPLARMSMYAKGVDIYLAPTADARERWQATLQHIALEGRCFVLGCNQYVHRDMYPADLEILGDLDAWPETLSPGGSAVYGPLGELLAGPLWNEAGMLYADLELAAVPRSKFDFDVTGHYARPDVFRLEVDESEHPPVG